MCCMLGGGKELLAEKTVEVDGVVITSCEKPLDCAEGNLIELKYGEGWRAKRNGEIAD